MSFPISSELFEKAKKVIPGGVNSPVRACRSVGCDPVFITRASGATLWDADGNEYVDFVGSWGPMIMGHAHPQIIEAVVRAAGFGTSFGAPTPTEIDLAAMVVEALPSVEKVRFVNSGTEATMSAIRLARGYTGKKVVVKFDGCYHGHADSFLVKAGSGVLTLGIPGSPGVPEEIVKNTISIPYNDEQALETTLRDKNLDIACVIVEPVAGNMGCIPPEPGFLQKLRSLTSELGIVLIFDEVITGFRLAYGGAQQYYNILPDLTCLGKIIGGGLPVGAYGGKAEIMNCVAPDGPVYQAGTLSGNPLAMAAGIAALRLLQQPRFYQELEAKSAAFAERLIEVAARVGIPVQLNRVGSMMTAFFTATKVTDFTSAMLADTERYARHYRQMLAGGVYLAPSQFEVAFISAAQSERDLDNAVKMTEWSFKKLVEK
ncbi:MAG TPA: glutamate-1-semialdehyde-2,1-aminomutase [Desulfobulbaceae bacterium]|nr:glutamate-1-semialdehyde-2,1-aminomutase [Desulfobulbaceae bacterium]